MTGYNLLSLCKTKKWSEVRKYLSSDASEEEKKSNVMYRDRSEWTCLHHACCRDPPDDIINTMIDIGGMELVMMTDLNDCTVLQSACDYGASYNIIKMLIEVGGKNLIMAKDENSGDTTLHCLCIAIKTHNKVAEKIKLILQVGDANLLLSTKNCKGKTPLEIATKMGVSKEIKKLLTVQSTTSVADMQMEAAHAQELLEASNRRAADLEATIEIQRLENADLSNEKDELLEASNRRAADLETTIETQRLENADQSNKKDELLEASNRRAADLETTIETQILENADLSNEKDDIEKKYKDKVDKLMRKLSKQQAELQLLQNSLNDVEVGKKRKHTNEVHKEGEGAVVQSQSQSSKRSKVGDTRNASSSSLDRNQAEGEDAELIDMLMSRCTVIRRELRSAKARNVELEQEIDDLAI